MSGLQPQYFLHGGLSRVLGHIELLIVFFYFSLCSFLCLGITFVYF